MAQINLVRAFLNTQDVTNLLSIRAYLESTNWCKSYKKFSSSLTKNKQAGAFVPRKYLQPGPMFAGKVRSPPLRRARGIGCSLTQKH